MTCSRCKQAHYCSKEHQTLDWRLGHKQACTQSEFEIVTETEDEIGPEVVEMEDYSEVIGSMGKEESML